MSDSYVAALLAERDAYITRGRRDRAAQVDAELARFGVVVDAPQTADATPAAETADAPVKRKPGRPRKAPEAPAD
jgi:hypothetical protein